MKTMSDSTTYAESKEEELEKKLEQGRKNKERINEFAKYQAMRVASHKKNVAAPIYKDKNGDLHWLNREQRRKLKKRSKHAKGKRIRDGIEGAEKAAETQEAQKDVQKEV